MADSQKALQELSRQLADDGKLIEAGWVSFRVICVPKDAPAVQLQEMRTAFMAGAQHLFSSMMTVLDPDAEPTEKDLRRMSLINVELENFVEELKARIPGRTPQ